MRQIFVLLSLASALTAPAFAQDAREDRNLPTPPHRFDRPVRFDNLSLDDGLQQGSIYDIHQDSQGFIWIGTQSGISRYDGYNFKNFTHLPFDSTSGGTARVEDIDEAPDGTLWLAATYEGLSRMDPATEKFTHYRHNRDDSTSLGAGWVNSVHVDQTGAVWVGFLADGLNRMDPDKPGHFVRYVHDPDDPASLSSDNVSFISEDATGTLWISTGNGLNRMDLNQPGRFVRYFVGQAGEDGISPDFASQIGRVLPVESEPGNVWVGSRAGLVKLNVNTGESCTVFPHGTVSMAADPDDPDVLWLTTAEEGLVRFDVEAETAARFRHDPSDAHSLIGDNTWSITTDRSGAIWVGTNPTGISKFNPSAISFASIVYDPTSPDGLAEANSWGLLPDKGGGLWVAGAGRGIVQRIDLKTGRVQRWEANPAHPTDPTRPAGKPFTFAEDSEGRIWISTSEGLNRYDPRTGLFEVYRHDPNNEQSLSANGGGSVYIDRTGAVWTGTRFDGLNWLDPESGKVTHFRHDPADSTTLNGNRISSILEDQAGILWFGTNAGINRMDPRKPGHFTRISHDRRSPKGITTGAVSSILERKREPGVLWISAYGGGLDRFDTQAGSFTHYTEQNSGLRDNQIYAILEDDQGRLWISSNRGLTRFDPETEEFSNYGLEHGLLSLEFNQWSAAKAPDGQMFFGGVNGINSFYPEAVGVNDLPPPVALTDLRLFNNPVSPGPESPLQQAISKTGEVELTYDQGRNVGFDFVALHYKNSAKNRYAYRLEGFDGDWIDAGTQRSATYTNLPPGSYTFRVKAANSDGIWNEEGAALQLIVLPPWWRTYWAYVLYGLLLVGAVVAADRFQRRRLQKKSLFEQAQLRAQAAESEKHAADARAQAAESDSQAAEARARALEADNERKKDAELLSEIGKELTATLDLETIFDRVYEHVNRLVEAPVFGIGFYREDHEQIEYRLAIENGKRYAPYSRDTADKNQFPVWCIEHRKPVFVNDVEKEYSRYLESFKSDDLQLEDGSVAGEPQSLIYLPLVSKDRVLGVLSIQSFRKNAYSEHDLNVLQALATYTAIAIDNADAYRRLNATLEHLRDAQQQLVQQEKLASLGQLTAGIAHEIKNPLNFVTNFSALNEELTAELAEAFDRCRTLLPPDRHREIDDLLTSLRLNSGHVAKHGRRADSIVKSMMDHASGSQGQRYPVGVNALLDEYVNIAYHGRRAQMPGFDVEIEKRFDDLVGTVEMAPQEIGRVVVNLLTNAFDAVLERKARSNGGYVPLISVHTRRQDGNVEILVADNGPGIHSEIRGRIFEPFFTTKPAGNGIGLGLSLSYDIITQGHGGTLTVSSDDGKGTEFTIVLPAGSS